MSTVSRLVFAVAAAVVAAAAGSHTAAAALEPDSTTTPPVTGTIPAPLDSYPAVVRFATRSPSTFWSSYVSYLNSLMVASRVMAAAASPGDTAYDRIFLGCEAVDNDGNYGCYVGFSTPADATASITAANNNELASYDITGAADATPTTTTTASAGGEVAEPSSTTAAGNAATVPPETTTTAEAPTTTTAPFVTGTIAAPRDQYPAVVRFTTSSASTFWTSFVRYLRRATSRGMVAAAAAGATEDGHIFLGCVAEGDAYGCLVGFSVAADATTALTAANNNELASYDITGAARAASLAAGRAQLAASLALALVAAVLLLA